MTAESDWNPRATHHDATPAFTKPNAVTGHRLVFRNASVEDAAFILELRTDAKIARFLSQTSPDLGRQVEWLRRYANDPSQVYFVIEDRAGERIGTVRLYDARGDSFCWGSWIIRDGSPAGAAVESSLMVYSYALSIGFRNAHFDVRKGNESVWQFHERFGARRTGETTDDYLYAIDTDAIRGSLQRYRKYLPEGIAVT